MDAELVYAQEMRQQKDDLVKSHAPMVKRIAHHILGRLPRTVLLDDMIQAGMIGLLEAAKNYDASVHLLIKSHG